MTTTDLQNVFKTLGKMIFLSQLAKGKTGVPGHGDAYRKVLMGTVDQAISGVASEYNLYDAVLVPYAGSLKATISALDLVPTAVATGVTNYLQKTVAPALGLSGKPTLSAIGDALRSAMQAATPAVVVTPSGTGGSNVDGIAMYLANMGIIVNQTGTVNVADSTYITDAVI